MSATGSFPIRSQHHIRFCTSEASLDVSLQATDFLGCEIAPLTGFEAAQADRTHADTTQVTHRQADGAAHLADLAVAALANRDRQFRRRTRAFHRRADVDVRGRGPAAFDEDTLA